MYDGDKRRVVLSEENKMLDSTVDDARFSAEELLIPVEVTAVSSR